MPARPRRFRASRRIAAELAMRTAGAGLIVAAWGCARMAYGWVLARGRQGATLAEFATCAAAFVLLAAGLALCLEGPGLLRRVPVPRRSAYARPRPASQMHKLPVDRRGVAGANSAE